MESKEYIKGVLYNIEDLLKQAKRDNRNAVIPELEEEIEQYNQVLKDLEVLEILKKESFLSLHDYKDRTEKDYKFYEEYIIEKKITREEFFKVKEWLDNDK